jgi:hypothetical protein
MSVQKRERFSELEVIKKIYEKETYIRVQDFKKLFSTMAEAPGI